MRNGLVATAIILSLFISLSGHPRSEAPPSSLTSIEDSSLDNNQDYQGWKKALLRPKACQELLRKWADVGLTVHITMDSPGSEATSGAYTKDYVFDGGKLTGATIALGTEFAKRSPRNVDAYPLLSSLSDVQREARAVAFLAHEFGHIENARSGGEAFLRQNKLLKESELGFKTHGWEWFKQEEYRRIVRELGAAPFDIVRGREIDADGAIIPVLQECFGGKMPANVRQAIQSYQFSRGGR